MRRLESLAAATVLLTIGARANAAEPGAAGTPTDAATALAWNWDDWPLEAVKRPLTPPRGMITVAPRHHLFRAAVGSLSTVPASYYSTDRLGVSFSVALTSSFLFGANLPGIYCYSDPARACDSYRHSGTGPWVSYGFFRRNQRQLAVGLQIYANAASKLEGALSVSGKATLYDRVALFAALSTRRPLEEQAGVATSFLSTGTVDVDVQIVQRVHAFVGMGATVTSGTGFSDGPRFAASAGAAAIFGRGVEIGTEVTRYGLFHTPAWDRSIPGIAVISFVRFFIPVPSAPG